MTFQELQDIFQTPGLLPWEYDYYVSRFADPKTPQEFLDHAYQSIEGLAGVWYEVNGLTVYFIVPKGTIVPEDFAELVEAITEVPQQPVEEGTE